MCCSVLRKQFGWVGSWQYSIHHVANPQTKFAIIVLKASDLFLGLLTWISHLVSSMQVGVGRDFAIALSALTSRRCSTWNRGRWDLNFWRPNRRSYALARIFVFTLVSEKWSRCVQKETWRDSRQFSTLASHKKCSNFILCLLCSTPQTKHALFTFKSTWRNVLVRTFMTFNKPLFLLCRTRLLHSKPWAGALLLLRGNAEILIFEPTPRKRYHFVLCLVALFWTCVIIPLKNSDSRGSLQSQKTRKRNVPNFC